ncbi:MAG: Molybdopterin converting factor, subunit 1 [Pedosphaera sp.]|jgi:sulfur-carrier protein|nr:Molybdopterin converting factor, subunit 1 [Pedosphaera sp.]
MDIPVNFYSYFKDLTGCAQTTVTVPDGSTLNDLFKQLAAQFPKLAPMQKSTLIAVGVEYQDRDYRLKPNDEVSLFPPVQGG